MNEAISTVPAGRDKAVDDARLLVTMSEDLNAPSPDHNLLVAFRFGSGRVQDAREDVVVPGPELIAGEDRYECWWYRGEISRSRHGDIRVAECDDYAFVVLQRDDVGFESFREHTYKAYRDLFQAVAGTRHKHLARIWNYFPDINVGDGDHEKYRQFSIGRADAFEEAGIYDRNMPAGTAVGTANGGLSIIALVSRSDFHPVENPRQVSAYNYPKQYGPRSPKFSRGAYITTRDHRLFLISGTAAIAGCESRFPDETQPQVEETLENLDVVAAAMSTECSQSPGFQLDTSSLLRVYIRNPGDLDVVATSLSKKLGSIDSNVIFLRADICRSELTVEIDGVRCV